MDKDFENFGASVATSVWGVAKMRFLDLGCEEKGAALVITLAMFFLMYLACCGVFAVSTAVKERVHLQNAADAAAYSAAVVQADTLSRIATINRAMSWTYADMTRLQMDYIVRRWLGHTCDHYEEDLNGDDDLDGLSDYNVNSIPYKLGLGHILGPYNGPCPAHKGLNRGWYIGADGNANTAKMVHLNGKSPLKYRMPQGASSKGLPPVGAGNDVLESEIRVWLGCADAHYLNSAISTDLVRQLGSMQTEIIDIGRQTAELLSVDGDSASYETKAVLLDNADQVKRVFDRWDASGDNAFKDGGSVLLMKTQIAFDKIAIARMNLCIRELAVKMPGRIQHCVQDVLDANLGESLGGGRKDVQYLLEQHCALGRELTGAVLAEADAGYLKVLRNRKSDENTFLAFSGQLTYDKEFKTGINQWFVRGDGNKRTEGDFGIQRSYKHWPEGPLSKFHATHSPLMPSSWNTERLEDVKASVALFSEWQWWSDTWFCFDIYLLVPPGKITIHVNALHWKELWPSRAECPHGNKPGLLGTKSGNFTTPNWSDLLNGLKGEAESACVKHHKWRPPTFRSHNYTPRLNFGVNFVQSLGQLLGNYEQIEKYHDGCVIYPDLFGSIPRSSIFKFTGYARLYADDPHLYTGTYVGMKALPLVVEEAYFGPAGTLSVGLRRKNHNVFMRILRKIEGIFRAFDPDWNGFGGATHTYVFASAKAGYKDKGEDADSQAYKVDWQPNNQAWNLCQSDWDAVFVPVRMACATAVTGLWMADDDAVLEDWVSDEGKWMTLDGGKGDTDGWDSISAPKGVLRGGNHKGALDWRALSHVMYH